MLALSIRQPYAEEILLGLKHVEYRTRATSIVGQPFYIYAGFRFPSAADLERYCKRQWVKGQLPAGVIVGRAVISHCTQRRGVWEWHLTDVRRLKRPIKPRKHPQPVWFEPF
jgi:hypothetical protein